MSFNAPIREAVILAAGKGERLSSTWNGKPKGCLELNGITLVERSIRQLRAAGIRRILLVVGYAASYYEVIARRHPDMELVHNDCYEISNSMYSLYCARHAIKTPFLLLESDLVYESRGLHELLACPRPNAILQSGFTRSGDEVYIQADGDRFVRMSKNPDELRDSAGELVGITKIDAPVFEAMIEVAGKHFRQDFHLHYEECINRVATRTPVYTHKVSDLVWAEIDTPEHLERVMTKVMPQLEHEWL